MGGDEIEERRERDLSSLGLSGRAAAYNFVLIPTRCYLIILKVSLFDTTPTPPSLSTSNTPNTQ
jgi:hypothetical protein